MTDKKIIVAALIVVAILLIAWYHMGRRRGPAGARSGFRPVPVSVCGGVYDEHYAVDMTGRNAAGTVFWDPFSTLSRVSLERYAESPEAAEAYNPVTGIGKTSTLRTMADRYRRNEALSRRSIYELQPWESGFMRPVEDGALSMMTQVPQYFPSGSCPYAGRKESDEFITDGPFGDAVLKQT
jgi:hypothetical protein